MEGRPRHIVITGQMASGKSTAAQAVAAQLGREHRDSDSDVENLTGRTGRQIATAEGVPALHQLEAKVLLDALNVAEPLVISAAASVVEDPACRRAAERAYVVVLSAAPATLQARAKAGAHRRDISLESLNTLIERRAELFAEVADITVSAEQPTDQIVDEIVTAWRRDQRRIG